MSEKKRDINGLIEQMACIKLIDDSEFKQADKAKKELIKVNNMGEIKQQIEQLSKEISKYIPDNLQLPTSVEFAVASQMADQIERDPSLPINQVNVDKKIVFEQLNLAIEYRDGRNVAEDIIAAHILIDGADGIKSLIEIPSDIIEKRDAEFNELSQRVHQSGATESEKSRMVGLMYAPSLDTFIKLGLKFSDIDDKEDFSRKCEIIKIINDRLEAGDTESAEYYCKALGITKEDLENKEYKDGLVHTMDTNDAEQDKVMCEINGLSSKIEILLDYNEKSSPELVKSVFDEINQDIQENIYSVDALFKALGTNKGLAKNRELHKKIVKLAIDRFKDPNGHADFDGHLLIGMFEALRKSNSLGEKDEAQSILDVINEKLKSENINLTMENALKLDLKGLETYVKDKTNEDGKIPSGLETMKWYINDKGIDHEEDRTVTGSEVFPERNVGNGEISEDKLLDDFKIGIVREFKKGGKDAALRCYADFAGLYSQRVQNEIKEFLSNEGYKEIEIQEPKKVDIKKDRRESLKKTMNEIAKNKGLIKAQEWIEDFIGSYPDKDIVIGAAIEFLELQKGTNEQFMDIDAKEAREGVFESIVLTGIEEPEIFERMQKIDRATSKNTVNKVLQQINESRTSINKVLGAVQMLGKNLNEKNEPTVEDKLLGFLNVENANLPHVDMFEKNRDGGTEPDDR